MAWFDFRNNVLHFSSFRLAFTIIGSQTVVIFRLVTFNYLKEISENLNWTQPTFWPYFVQSDHGSPRWYDSTTANTHHLLCILTTSFLVLGLLLSLFIIGVAANVVVCITLTRGCRLKRHLSNFMLFHLLVTNMVYRLLVLPSYLIAAISPVESKDFICKISQTLLSLVHSAIFTSLVVIALDRHHAITKPFQRLRHKPNFLMCITAVWGYSIVCAFPHIFTEKITTLIGSNNTYYNHRGVNITVLYRVCAPLSTFRDSVNQELITTAYFTLAFLLPLVILTVAYSSIAVFLRRKSRNGSTSQAAMKSKGKALRMLVLMVLGFVVCIGTPLLHDLMIAFGYGTTAFSVFAFILQLSSSLVNVLIYGFYSAEFRQRLTCLRE